MIERNLCYFDALQGLSKAEATPRITEALQRRAVAEQANEKSVHRMAATDAEWNWRGP